MKTDHALISASIRVRIMFIIFSVSYQILEIAKPEISHPEIRIWESLIDNVEALS